MATGTIKKVTNDSGTIYCMMPDGTAMAWGVSTDQTVEAGMRHDFTIGFPFTFISAPTVVANVTGGDYTPVTEITGPNITSRTTTQFKARVVNKYSTDLQVSISWFAVGRWK